MACLLHCADGSGVQWLDVVLERPGAVVLYHRAPGRLRRSGRGFRTGELRLGHDPGHGSDRENRVEDVAVPQGWTVHRAGEGGRTTGRRYPGRRHSDGPPGHPCLISWRQPKTLEHDVPADRARGVSNATR